MTADDLHLLRLEFASCAVAPAQASPAGHPVLAQAAAWLDNYFSGSRPDPLDLPTDPRGTFFQKTVWKAVLEVGYGQTSSYGAIANKIGTRSARAVGGAIARNPLAIVIPCHRILMGSGKICGYAWGTPIKQWLLWHEGALSTACKESYLSATTKARG